MGSKLGTRARTYGRQCLLILTRRCASKSRHTRSRTMTCTTRKDTTKLPKLFLALSLPFCSVRACGCGSCVRRSGEVSFAKTGVESRDGAVLNLGLCPSILALEAPPVACFVFVGHWDCLCGLAHFYAWPKGRMDERTRRARMEGGGTLPDNIRPVVVARHALYIQHTANIQQHHQQ